MSIAVSEAAGLRPEALKVRRGELRRRKLDDQTSQAIEAQLAPPDRARFDALVERFRALPCPRCGDQGLPLNGFLVARARGNILFAHYQKELVIGCPECIVGAAKEADKRTALLGWWAIPWGPIHSLRAFRANAAARRASAHVAPSPDLVSYITANPGEAELRIAEARPAM